MKRTDAPGAGMFLSRQLEQRFSMVFEPRYPQYWAEEGMYFPATADLEVGAEALIEETADSSGGTAFLSDTADDFPLVDASISEKSFKTYSLVAGAGWTVEELNKDAKAGRNIRLHRMNALKRSFAERIHNLSVFGDSDRGYTGLLSSTDVPLNSSSYNPNTASFQDHIDFFTEEYTAVRASTNLVAFPDTVLIPEKLRAKWASTVLSGTNISVLSFIMDNYGQSAGGSLRRIVTVNEVQSSFLEDNGVHAASTNKDRMMILPADPQAVERKFYAMNYLEPQLRGLKWIVPAYCGSSEVIFHYPDSCRYTDFAKVA